MCNVNEECLIIIDHSDIKPNDLCHWQKSTLYYTLLVRVSKVATRSYRDENLNRLNTNRNLR